MMPPKGNSRPPVDFSSDSPQQARHAAEAATIEVMFDFLSGITCFYNSR
jgi:hypothetical protein